MNTKNTAKQIRVVLSASGIVSNETTNQNQRYVRVYRHAGKSRRSRDCFFCVACCDELYRAGKFHASVVVPAIDLEGKRCAICAANLVHE